MTDLDQFRAELAGSLAGLSPSQRLKAGREMAERLGVVLAAIESGEIDASATETARLQGAAVAGHPGRVTLDRLLYSQRSLGVRAIAPMSAIWSYLAIFGICWQDRRCRMEISS